VAAVNGPAATVVSGEPAAVAELAAACEAAGVRAGCCRWTTPRTARRWRSSAEEILPRWTGSLPGQARVPMVSAMTGEWAGGPELDAGYWYAEPALAGGVRPGGAVLAGAGHQVFIEAPRTRC
jgi:acyl transferase domain-containing protein